AVAGQAREGQPVELRRALAEVDRVPGVRDQVLDFSGAGVSGAILRRSAEQHVVPSQHVQNRNVDSRPSVLIVGGCISTGSQRAQLTAAQRVLGRLLSASNGAFVRARVVEDLGAASRQGGEVEIGRAHV